MPTAIRYASGVCFCKHAVSGTDHAIRKIEHIEYLSIRFQNTNFWLYCRSTIEINLKGGNEVLIMWMLIARGVIAATTSFDQHPTQFSFE